MVAPITQHEWEALGEAEAAFAPEGEWEAEFETESAFAPEGEWENEFETGEAFLGSLAKQGWNWLTKPDSPQRNWALDTARSAIAGGSSWAGERVGNALGTYGASLLPAKEWEAEFQAGFGENEWEGEWESEYEVNPVRKVYLDAMLEHMAHEAAHAESEQEAVESFLPLVPMLAGKLLPLAARIGPRVAAKVLPNLARAVTRVSPQLSRGITNITRSLYRRPVSRPLLRAVPSIAQRTMRRIVRQVAMGRPVTPRTALRTLAQQTYRVLSHPGARRSAILRHQGMDHRYHGTTGTRIVSPGGAPRAYAGGMAGPARTMGVCTSCGARSVRLLPGSRMGRRCLCSRCACSV